MVTATAWGLNWPVMKLLMRDWPPYAFRIFAALGAVSLLMAVAAWRSATGCGRGAGNGAGWSSPPC